MSAVSSTTGDRESEALRRAQRAHEPSMEEILASIRNIIADDRENARSTVKGPVQRTAAPAAGPQIVYSKDADLGLAPRAGSPIGLKADRLEEAGTAELVSPRVVWSYAPASEEPYAEAQTPVPAAAEPEARLEPKEATARLEPPPDDRSIEAVGNSGAPIAAAEQPVIEFVATAALRGATDEATGEAATRSEGEAPLLSPEADRAVAFAFTDLSATLARRADEAADGMIREMLRPLLKDWLDRNMPGLVEGLVRAEIERITQAPR